ncbi:MAG: helix-turn-helix domain-containing protein [Clostridia bacterium]|nr:helix-turn-helix domain-containing protein [Clostridia bacterium]
MTKTELSELYKIMFSDYPEIVSVAQMQTMLGISRHAAYDLVRDGSIPAVKIGTSFRILKLNIIKYMADNLAA